MVEHCGQARLVWNVALEQMNTAHRMGLRCDWGSWDQQLAEARNAEGLEWLKDGSSSVQQQALRQLRQAWRSFFANPSHFGRPRFRSKARTTEGFVVRDVTVVKLNRKWSAVRVPKAGWVKFRRDRPVGDHGMAHVTRDRCGRWHVSFAAPQPAVEPVEGSEGCAVGVDRGVTHTVATSDGELFTIPQATPREVKNLKTLQRRLARQQPGSHRYQRTKASIAKTLAHWADTSNDWVEQLSTRLVAHNAVIVFEALRPKDMSRSASGTLEEPGINVAAKRGLNRRIQAACWGKLAQRTCEKAAASGVEVVFVDPAYTSQRCSHCGHTCRGNRDGKDFMCVACGHTDDADINAANNILADGLAVIRREGTTSENTISEIGPTKRQPQPVLPFAA